MKSVNVFAFTNKLKLVMKGHELELWIASFNNMQLYHSTAQVAQAHYENPEQHYPT